MPLTSDVNLFRSLCSLGTELVALHLLESPKLAKPIVRFPVEGSNLVDKGFPKYVAPGYPAGRDGTGKPVREGRVYINKPPLGPLLNEERKREQAPPHSPPQMGRGIRGGDDATGKYFEGIPPEVWNFHIGGYQVCEKWLKDRRDRSCSILA